MALVPGRLGQRCGARLFAAGVPSRTFMVKSEASGEAMRHGLPEKRGLYDPALEKGA